MKMKMFSAPSVDEAMAMVRKEMGPDAVILSTRDEDGVVEIRAAIERSFNHRFAAPKFAEARPRYDATRDQLSVALRWQGAPDGFIQMVSEAGSRLGAGSEPLGALSAGLEGILTFAPLQPRLERSILLVGPHGSGKTTASAKLARRLSDLDSPLEAVAADFDASGQCARLAALMMKPTITAALSPDALVRLVQERDKTRTRLVIDGPPFNPLDAGDMNRLTDLISRLNIEPVLVMSAEGHPMDLEDNARAFAAAGIRRVILTRLDAVRRRGGIIAAISSARLSIAQLGMGSNAASGLAPASASRIARLLLADAPEAELLKGAA
ncbi:MAG: GTP-binding protein [Alphaproteobacteria bacterium]|nr:GTP-binding protein [Alphaproteobacteria bacterium]